MIYKSNWRLKVKTCWINFAQHVSPGARLSRSPVDPDEHLLHRMSIRDSELVRVQIPEATALTVAILVAAGADATGATIVAEHLVESDLRGLHSHGLLRIPQYVRELVSGEIDGRAEPEIVRRGAASVLIDGKLAFGQVAGACAARHAESAAADYGVGLAIVRRAGHAGRIGAYVERAAAAGNVVVAFCSGPRSGHRVAPFGGIDGRLSTNPIAFAFPGDDGPVIADFSTSTVPEGVVRRLRDIGAPAPEGSIQDASGAPSRDPAVLYEDPAGTILPLGGPRFGHKGYALGLLVEAMTTVLAGEEATDPRRLGNNLTVLVVAGGEDVVSAGPALARYVRSSRPADPDHPVLLPGDPEKSARQGNADVSIDPPTWHAINELATRYGVAVPPPVA
jgi:LDH2 family malate/lactate/ureidoglycolate dehydrogenase